MLVNCWGIVYSIHSLIRSTIMVIETIEEQESIQTSPVVDTILHEIHFLSTSTELCRPYLERDQIDNRR